jgi:predicted RNA-binding protein with PIN domain
VAVTAMKRQRKEIVQRDPAVRRPPSREELEPARFRWIVDGHNAIFAVRALEELQLGGQRQQARRALEESLEAFGRAIGAQVWVVYDGNQMERNPDAGSWLHLRAEYSFPPEEADDRICFLVDRSLREGERPLVVTSDRKTLTHRLPAGARTLPVMEFFRRVHARLVRMPEKWEPEGLEDVERHFLTNSPFEEDRIRPDPPSADGTLSAGDDP